MGFEDGGRAAFKVWFGFFPVGGKAALCFRPAPLVAGYSAMSSAPAPLQNIIIGFAALVSFFFVPGPHETVTWTHIKPLRGCLGSCQHS